MPVELKPKPPAPSPHGFVQSAGKQEDHFAAGSALAASLGWSGDDPDMLGNGISAEDARGFLTKVLHECFIAGAKGGAIPGHLPACEHLGLSDVVDVSAVESALSAAFKAGKGATVTQHAITHGVVGANVTIDSDKVLKSGKAV